MIKSATTNVTKNSQMEQTSLPIFGSDVTEATNNPAPIDGVNKPIVKLMHMMIPK